MAVISPGDATDDGLDGRPLSPRQDHQQQPARAIPGAAAAGAAVGSLVLAGVLIATGGSSAGATAAAAVLAVVVALLAAGFVVVLPNESRVLILFGRYIGTVTDAGLWWVNPFTVFWRQRISLRVRNFQGERINVNDGSGNPIEIAEVMLRRQQAEAILAARKTMVAGAVGLVQMALAQLADSDLVELDPERKATMVSNLMVVLSGDHAPAPVINTGTLYT